MKKIVKRYKLKESVKDTLFVAFLIIMLFILLALIYNNLFIFIPY